MLYQCYIVQNFWNRIKDEFPLVFSNNISAYEAIIGAYDEDYSIRLRKNIVLLHSRIHIYKANCNNTPLDIFQLLEDIHEHHNLERMNLKHQEEIDELFNFFP